MNTQKSVKFCLVPQVWLFTPQPITTPSVSPLLSALNTPSLTAYLDSTASTTVESRQIPYIPPLNLSSAVAVSVAPPTPLNLGEKPLTIRLPVIEEGDETCETPLTYDMSPLSPGTFAQLVILREEEESLRKEALAQAFSAY